jgi:excisionase family DNA binding protein
MPLDPPALTLQEAADELGVHYMTAYRYVRLGRLPATQEGAEWRVRPADVSRLKAAPRPRSHRKAESTLAARSGLEARMVAGDRAGAWGLIESRLAMGSDPSGVLTDLVVPALRSIGDRWEAGELSIAEEHRATAVASRLIGRLGLQFGRKGKRRGTVVLAAPEGDLHTLPVAIAADLFRWQGFEAVELGANSPAESVAEAARRSDQLKAVGIVSSTSGLDAKITAAVAAVRRDVPGVPILLGGGGIRDQRHAKRLGVDIYTGTGSTAALEAVEQIVG